MEFPSDSSIWVNVIYIIHHILVEERWTEREFEVLSKLLKVVFSESKEISSNDPEYLFFIGKILYIEEWHFGIDDDLKPIKDRLAFSMQKKAHELKPDNLLFEWAMTFSKGEQKKSNDLSKTILQGKGGYLKWLKSKRFPGRYIIESLEYCHNF